MKVIFHLDLDAFFVSAHQSINRDLMGKPVVVAKDGYRSIVTAASYEAKNLGVKVPMPLFEAKKIIPNLIVMQPQFALYNTLAHHLFHLIANNYTTQIEVASIDECYIDVSKIWQKYHSPFRLAKQMQSHILKDLNLPCSIGIANNKFVAKMASPLHKPYGITVIKPGTFLDIFGKFDVEKCWGVGHSTAKTLKEHHILTIGDLANSDENLLTYLFKKRGLVLKNHANGLGENQLIIAHNQLKSIGNSLTFADGDKNDRGEILKILSDLATLVATRAYERNLMGYVISVSIKSAGNYEIKRDSKQITLDLPIYQYRDIYKYSVMLFDTLWNGQTIKFISVTLHKLIDVFKNSVQSQLFSDEANLRPLPLTKTNNNLKKQVNYLIANLNQQLQANALMTAYEKLVNIKKQQHQSRYLSSDSKLKYHNK